MEKENKNNKDEKKIVIIKNGPYIVSGNLPLDKEIIVEDKDGTPISWKKIKQYPNQEKYDLCRCGHSKNKPYCDGTHIKIKFDGTETASRESYLNLAEEINGHDLKLTDHKSLCVGAGFCHRAGGTWKLTRESDDPEKKKIAIETACNCPSGRLIAWDKKTGKAIEPESEPSITLVEEAGGVMGPIWVKGKVKIISSDGKEYETRNRVTLCRCGRSFNKPFCDGTHAITETKSKK